MNIDTSGVVAGFQWRDFTDFERGYVRAMLLSSLEYLGTNPDTTHANFEELAPETIDLIRRDCERIAWAYTARDEFEGQTAWRERAQGLLKDFPPLAVELGDDGKVYLKESTQ